jgi:hypothetical protein
MATMHGGVDHPGEPVGSPQHVACPQVTVNQCGRLRWSGQLRECTKHALDVSGVVGSHRASCYCRPEERTNPALGPEIDPGRPRSARKGQGCDPAVTVGIAECRHPGPVGSRERSAQPLGGGCRRPARLDPLQDEAGVVGADHGGNGYAARDGSQLTQAGGLPAEEIRRRTRPGLDEYRSTVVEPATMRNADVPTGNRLQSPHAAAGQPTNRVRDHGDIEFNAVGTRHPAPGARSGRDHRQRGRSGR